MTETASAPATALADTLVRAGLLMSTSAAQMLGVPPMTLNDFMNPSLIILRGWTTTDPLWKFISDLASSWYAVLMHVPTILTYDLGVLMPMWAPVQVLARLQARVRVRVKVQVQVQVPGARPAPRAPEAQRSRSRPPASPRPSPCASTPTTRPSRRSRS